MGFPVKTYVRVGDYYVECGVNYQDERLNLDCLGGIVDRYTVHRLSVRDRLDRHFWKCW